MKYIDYGEFKIIREYKKRQRNITISGEADMPYRLEEFTGRRYSGFFDRLVCRCNYRKMRRINAAIKRSNRTLNIFGLNKYGLLKGQAFNTKMKNPKFDYIFKNHLREIGWYEKNMKR